MSTSAPSAPSAPSILADVGLRPHVDDPARISRLADWCENVGHWATWYYRARRSLLPTHGYIAISAGKFCVLTLDHRGIVEAWQDCECCPPRDKGCIAVSAGSMQGMVLRDDGTVKTWGNSVGYDFIGPSFFANFDPTFTFYGLAKESRYVAISAGATHIMALREDGRVIAIGDNSCGQCNIPEGRYIAISAGAHHSLMLREDGSIATAGGRLYPYPEPPSARYVAISAIANTDHSLAIREDGRVVAWGDWGCEVLPLEGRFIAASVGFNHIVALCEDGRVIAIGDNSCGQCNIPEGRYIAISAGMFSTYVISADGNIAACGTGLAFERRSYVYTTCPYRERYWLR